MSQGFEGQPGDLALAVATWVYQLHAAGIVPDDAELAGHCAAVEQATEREAGDAAGMDLVRRVDALLGGGEPAQVATLASQLYGDRVKTDLGGGSREERVARIRKYQFGSSLPWLARIWERDEAGEVGPSWLLVERVTDQVFAMDPNPWNDIDEERHLPLADFQVLWELDACTALYLA